MSQQLCRLLNIKLCKVVSHRLYQTICFLGNLFQFLTNNNYLIQIIINIKLLLSHLSSLVSHLRI